MSRNARHVRGIELRGRKKLVKTVAILNEHTSSHAQDQIQDTHPGMLEAVHPSGVFLLNDRLESHCRPGKTQAGICT